MTDQLSYDVFAQAANAIPSLLGGLEAERVLAIGASQSASRMTVYYNVVLPQEHSGSRKAGSSSRRSPCRRR